MKYFMIPQDRQMSNPILPGQIDKAVYVDGAPGSQFRRVPDMSVSYFPNSPDLEKPDILYQPAFLVSDRLKRLLAKYNPGMQFKGIRCYPEDFDDPESLLYWWPNIGKVDCVSERTEKYPNGTIRHLVIQSEKIQGKSILMVDGTLETIVLVSMELAESMLRRGMWGMDYVPVDMALK